MSGGRPKGSKNSTRKKPHNVAPVMDAPELCVYLGIHRVTLYRLIKAGRIAYFRIGSDYRFNRESIDEWMRSRRSGGPNRIGAGPT